MLRKNGAAEEVKKKISAGAGLIFKGSGFYITDYRSENYKEGAKKDSTAAKPAADTKTSTPAESKPAPKTETKKAKSPAKPQS